MHDRVAAGAVHPVYVVDDDAGIRAELADLLTAAGFLVTTFKNGDAIVDAAPTLPPGCILLDIHMPGMDGLAVQKALAQHDSCHQVVILTGAPMIRTIVVAMQGGAVDYLEKPFTGQVLIEAVATAQRRLTDALDRQERKRCLHALLDRLSPREAEVMQGIVAGQPNKIIAYRLGLSIRTVELYRAGLKEKIGAQTLGDIFRIMAEAEDLGIPVPSETAQGAAGC